MSHLAADLASGWLRHTQKQDPPGDQPDGSEAELLHEGYDMSDDFSTIGSLRDALASTDPEALVFIDNRPPTALSSYRGYYDHLAIERSSREHDQHKRTALDKPSEPFELNMAGYGTYSPGHGEVAIKQPATVGELVKALDLAIGATFEGYKGGQFSMDFGTSLWVSEYGNCDSLRIAGVESLPGRVDLVTTEVDW